MKSELLSAFYQTAQDNLQLSPLGAYTNAREVQASVTIEQWQEARQALDALKGQPIACEQDDVKKLVDFINIANNIGLMCRFISSDDLHDKVKDRAFDKTGIELHVTL